MAELHLCVDANIPVGLCEICSDKIKKETSHYISVDPGFYAGGDVGALIFYICEGCNKKFHSGHSIQAFRETNEVY